MSSRFIAIGEYRIRVDSEDVLRILQQAWNAVVCASAVTFYTRVSENGKPRRVTLQRFILNPPKSKHISRINSEDPFDYRKSAFRLDTMSGRQASRAKAKREATSKFKGVYFESRSKLWIAAIYPNGRSIRLGAFRSELEAANAYNEAARMYYGRSAHLNDVSVPRSKKK